MTADDAVDIDEGDPQIGVAKNAGAKSHSGAGAGPGIAVTAGQENPAIATPGEPGTGRAILSEQVASTVAEALADQIRDAAPQTLWAAVVDKLRRELNISGEAFLDLLD